ncbi:MAG: hypothetical protein WBW78_21810 [Terrimicrobiaceae bacterium]
MASGTRTLNINVVTSEGSKVRIHSKESAPSKIAGYGDAFETGSWRHKKDLAAWRNVEASQNRVSGDVPSAGAVHNQRNGINHTGEDGISDKRY